MRKSTIPTVYNATSEPNRAKSIPSQSRPSLFGD
jgi:hypothetical protein